jgi:gamma-glutamylcyclotransferase (GGCT)/AIG2-like uncharacterized protein YtfP
MQYLFIYGTLCFSEIIEKLTGKNGETIPAVLYGYKIRMVKGCDYPAIVKDSEEKVKGFLIKISDENTMKIIAFYEGKEYREENVKVNTNSGIEKAQVFVWDKSVDLLEDKDWDYQQFEKESLPVYLDKIIPETLEEYKKQQT